MKPDWNDAPEWANWLAMDSEGDWYWYESEPSDLTAAWGSLDKIKFAGHILPGWRDSLCSRPQTTTPQPEGQGDEGKRDA